MKTDNPLFQRKLIWGVLMVLGLLISISGMFGVWLQGEFWKVFIQATESEVKLALTLPVMFNFMGGLLIATVIYIGPFTEQWSTARRLLFVSVFGIVSLIAFHVLGGLAARLIEPILR